MIGRACKNCLSSATVTEAAALLAGLLKYVTRMAYMPTKILVLNVIM